MVDIVDADMNIWRHGALLCGSRGSVGFLNFRI